MNTIETSLTLLPLFLCSTPARDYTKLGLPEGATTRLGKGTINDIAYSPDGTLLAVAGSIGIWLYDTATLQEVNLLTGHTGPVEGVAFSSDGRLLASGGGYSDWKVRLWDAQTGEHLRTFSGYTASVECVAFSPEDNTLACGQIVYNSVELWYTATGKHPQTLDGHTEKVSSIAARMVACLPVRVGTIRYACGMP